VLQSFGGQFEAGKLTGRLGDYYAFLTNGFKPYCCAIDIHSPIDALTGVITAHDLAPQDIAGIVVPLAHTIKLHSGTIGPEPQDITGAQLSQHYSLALTVCKRSNSFSTYMDALRSGFKEPTFSQWREPCPSERGQPHAPGFSKLLGQRGGLVIADGPGHVKIIRYVGDVPAAMLAVACVLLTLAFGRG
jgi:hypothetical protein